MRRLVAPVAGASAVLLLGVIGYSAFAIRRSSWPVRILGCLGTAAFGVAMILLKAVIH